MNKNPFVPQPSYNPPLPPGPPPAAQPDYSAYWAAAAAAQQQPQWNVPQQQPRPPPEQSALYANYGYGGQNLHWQQRHNHQQQQQPPQQHYQPPPPVVQPPPPPPQPQYNPYQPSAGYQQPYVPQPPPQPIIPQPQFQHPHPIPQPQPYYPQQQPQQQQQQQQQRHNHGLHHTPPQHLPPAKRQRFDGPQHHPQQRQPGPPPPQPQFQAPPPPPAQLGIGMYQGQMQGQGQPTGPSGGNRGGLGGRGGNISVGRGRGGPIGPSRGGLSGGVRGGRGGSMFMHGGGGGGRGGGSGGGVQLGSLRGHGSRGGFGNKDYHNRRGGSFNAGAHQHHQNNMSGGSNFRGRGQGHTSSRGGGGAAFGTKDGSMTNFGSSSGKKDENRRTLTDFKIVGLEMPDLDWSWGVLPSSPIKAEEKEVAASLLESSNVSIKDEAMEADVSADADNPDSATKADGSEPAVVVGEPKAAAPDAEPSSSSVTTLATPPPSRIRIYFHTPVSADDSHPIPHGNASFSLGAGGAGMDSSRKGKRKKLEDDDGEEGGRERPPPPGMSDTASVDLDGVGRGSVAPSVAETASEGDWLMAAIAEDEGEADADGDDQDQLCVSQVEDAESAALASGGGGDDGTRSTDGDGHDLSHSGGQPGDGPHDGQSPPAKAGGAESFVASNAPDGLPSTAAADSQSEGVASGVGVPEGSGIIFASGDTQPISGGNGVDGFSSATLAADPIASQTSISSSNSGSGSAPVAQSQSDTPHLDGEQSADHVGYPESQVSEQRSSFVGAGAPKPLQACSSFASTVPDNEPDHVAQESGLFTQDEGTTQVDENVDEQVKPMDEADQEHLPEPPASPTSNTLLSTSSGSTYGGEPPQSTAAAKAGRTPSANRLSISYAAGSRRLVVDAEVVEYLRVYRAEGRIEVYISLDKDEEDGLKGVLIEGLSDTTKSYLPLPTLSDMADLDPTLPFFSKAEVPSKMNLIIHLDTDRPLSEPKWVKSGDVQEWLKSMFGRMFWVAGDAADGWEKKIEVVDPDPAPTIWTVLDGWAVNSPVGVQTERQRFIKTHMSEIDNVLEILLRLVRGERATPFSQSTPAISAPSISGPLLTALSQGSAHGAQQTHVSLAVLAMFRVTVEYAQKASGDKGKFRNTYDSDNTVFSPQGRLHQVEYALEAVKQGSAAVGLRSKTHAVLLALKRSTGELASYQQKMFRIDDHVGIAIAGLTSDARVLSNFMRQQAMASRMAFNRPMPVNRLVSSIADKAQVNTQEYGRRPYGVGFLVIGQDQSGPHLFEFSPSGNSYEYYAMSIGARSQSAKTYLEKHYESFADCNLEDLIRHGLHALRETLQQDKELNVNNTSVGIIGPVGQHEKPVLPAESFRIVEGDSLEIYLQSMEKKEAAEAAAPAPAVVADEDVQMAE
ncbi:hypothetical protein BV22DRAFT_1124290 [Leucogyrophana mollusca]|uniref:Uncharacterized protein n=1 Tax=Leucogyrophana mollusca TaxID=85980 RepID=A0ACB8C140_9AGAM|nr:hypothetical protein BV22DRAFT_1124290 [Leucogyrophana mollusca]